jgi:hypothetical protein
MIRRGVNDNLAEFAKTHPDVEKHWVKMAELGKRLQPSEGMGEQEYLSELYSLVTLSERTKQSDGEKTKEVIDSMRKAAAKADSPDSGVSDAKVSKTAPNGLPLGEAIKRAYEDASQGISYE